MPDFEALAGERIEPQLDGQGAQGERDFIEPAIKANSSILAHGAVDLGIKERQDIEVRRELTELRGSLLEIFRDGHAEVRAFRAAQPNTYLHVRSDMREMVVRRDEGWDRGGPRG